LFVLFVGSGNVGWNVNPRPSSGLVPGDITFNLQ
jgi:hypothetical protein